jgi:hypothetical protein
VLKKCVTEVPLVRTDQLRTTMKIVFLDDSRQNKPTRSKLGPLVALGGIAIDSERLLELTEALTSTCRKHGFPENEPFKWSPGRELWMHSHLKDEKRQSFLLEVLACAAKCEAKAFFSCVDSSTQRADPKSKTPERDVYNLILERVEGYLNDEKKPGLIIVDRSGGDLKGEEKFLANLIEQTREGTTYVVPKQIAIPVLSCPSRLCRPLQLADVITSSTLARVAGESSFTPPIIESAKRLYYQKYGRIGGYGVKLHPAKKLANLYHWHFGDDTIIHDKVSWGAPLAGLAFSKSDSIY